MVRMLESTIEGKYKSAVRKLVLLDYDGTLVDFAPHASLAIPSRHLLDVLAKLGRNSETSVFIVTGRKQHEIDGFFAGNAHR